MNRREKIIVGLMALAVLYGAYEFLFAGGGKKPAALRTLSMPSADAVVTQVAAKISAADHRKQDSLLLATAAAELKRNPFSPPADQNTAAERMKVEKKKRAQGENRMVAGRFVYSGYLEMGTRRFAVINGMEYTVGETIPPEGVVLRQIEPDAVLIGVPKTGETVRIELLENR